MRHRERDDEVSPPRERHEAVGGEGEKVEVHQELSWGVRLVAAIPWSGNGQYTRKRSRAPKRIILSI
jgi:hypothetical protein